VTSAKFRTTLVPKFCSLLIVLSVLVMPAAIKADASQITASLVPEYNTGSGTFSAVKFLELQYPPDSAISREFNGKDQKVSFFVNGTTDQKDTAALVDAINHELLQQSLSGLQVTSLDFLYTGTIKGSADRTEVSYKVDIMPKFSGFVLAGNSTQGKMLVDMTWRALTINGPVSVATKYGNFNINYPVGLFQATDPEFAQALLTDNTAAGIMTSPILDFRDIGRTDLNQWDHLFDPTKSQPSGTVIANPQDMGSAKVISVYSLGECSLKQGCPQPDEKMGQATVEGTSLKLDMTTPQPNAQIQIAGYATIQNLKNAQVLAVTLSGSSVGPNELFPIEVLLVFGGMMGSVAVFVLMKARK
jgi:hypothetical protein